MANSSPIKKISAKDVAIGMYICKLDCPWQQTPFAVQGFYVRDLGEIKQLHVHCDYVFIDIQKGIAIVDDAPVKKIDPSSKAYKGKISPLRIKRDVYPIQPLNYVMANTHQVYKDLCSEISLVMSLAKKDYLKTVKRLGELSVALINYFLMNPDALVWLVRVRKADDNPYYYSIRSVTWALLLARHIGLAKSDMYALVLAILLKDIGLELLSKEERRSYFDKPPGQLLDPKFGTKILKQTLTVLRQASDIHPKVIKTIKMSGERLNGSGYPQKTTGDDIFLLSKIVAIAGFFDEVSYLKGAKCAIPTSQAVAQLYKVRGSHFQEELVVEFIKAIGLYPTGTLTLLNTGEVAIVAEQHNERRLKPKVILVLDKDKQALEKLKILDLFADDEKKQALIDAGKKNNQRLEKIDIIEEVQPYDYPIKVTMIRETHIKQCSKKSLFSFLK